MGASDMFAFVAQFGPMLGELAARNQMLEQRVEVLEAMILHGAGASGPAATTADQGVEGDEGGEIELPGIGKVGMGDLFKRYMPAGGPGGFFGEALKRGMAGATAPAAPTPPAAPPPAPPAEGK